MTGRQSVGKRRLNIGLARFFANCLAQIGQHCRDCLEPARVPCGTIVEEKNLTLRRENPVEHGLVVRRECSRRICSR